MSAISQVQFHAKYPLPIANQNTGFPLAMQFYEKFTSLENNILSNNFLEKHCFYKRLWTK